MKPLYGTFEHVDFVGWEEGEPWGTWTCHACGHKQTGCRVRDCEFCGVFPKWQYKDSIISVAKTYLKNTVLRVIWRVQGALRKIEKKLLDGDYAV